MSQKIVFTPTECVDEVVIQYSMLFDGVNEYINVPHNTNINFERTDSFSVTAWVKVVNYGSASNQSVFTKRANVNTAGYSMYFLVGDLYVYINNTAANAILVRTNGVSFTNGEWYDIGFTYNGSSTAGGVIIYVDDVAVPMFTVTNALTTTIQNVAAMLIAGRFAVAAYLAGNIGYVRIWNMALTPTQISTNHNGGVMLDTPIESANLVFGWRGGADGLFGTNWLFLDESGTNINPSPVSVNIEFVDRTTDTP